MASRKLESILGMTMVVMLIMLPTLIQGEESPCHQACYNSCRQVSVTTHEYCNQKCPQECGDSQSFVPSRNRGGGTGKDVPKPARKSF